MQYNKPISLVQSQVAYLLSATIWQLFFKHVFNADMNHLHGKTEIIGLGLVDCCTESKEDKERELNLCHPSWIAGAH